jgi:hypothetical protein
MFNTGIVISGKLCPGSFDPDANPNFRTEGEDVGFTTVWRRVCGCPEEPDFATRNKVGEIAAGRGAFGVTFIVPCLFCGNFIIFDSASGHGGGWRCRGQKEGIGVEKRDRSD